MVSIYVSELPKTNLECPFFDLTICNLEGKPCECKDGCHCGHLKELPTETTNE